MLCRILGIREQYLEGEGILCAPGKKLPMIVEELSRGIALLFPQNKIETILLGSHAGGDADPESDIDVLFLVNASRQDSSDKNWQIRDLAAELFLERSIAVSPLVESREYFARNLQVLPFCRRVERKRQGSAPDIT